MSARRFLSTVSWLAMLALLAAPLTSGCGRSGSAGNKETEPVMVQTELFFGRNVPSGGEVSEEDFQAFLEEVVTREFPAGLTVFDAYGQQQDRGAPLTGQKTKVVLLVHQKGSAGAAKVAKVIKEYRDRFGKPQVMHTTESVEPEFFPGGRD